MKEKDRKLMRRRLDAQMQPFRRAAKEKNPGSGLLRAVRHAMGISIDEVAKEMGISRACICDMEAREMKGTIQLLTMSRMAEAMGCKMIYGIVPREGGTIEALVERRRWAELLGVPLRTETEKNAAIRTVLRA